MAKRKFYSPEFKAAVLAEVSKKGNSNKTVGAKYLINANTISSWKSDARVGALVAQSHPAASALAPVRALPPAPARANPAHLAEIAVLRETVEVYKRAYRDLAALMGMKGSLGLVPKAAD